MKSTPTDGASSGSSITTQQIQEWMNRGMDVKVDLTPHQIEFLRMCYSDYLVSEEARELTEWKFLRNGIHETTFQLKDIPQETLEIMFGDPLSTREELVVSDSREVVPGDERDLRYWQPAADLIWVDEVRATDPNTGGQKGKKPEEYSLIPPFALAEVARVYGMGAKKYDSWNWAKGYPYSWALSALYRHIEAFRRGENTDAESGLSHLAHATFHLFTLIEFEKHNLGTDDRWTPDDPS